MLAAGALVLFFAGRGRAAVLKPLQGIPTAEMTAWSSSILNGPLPMGSTVRKTFGDRKLVAKIEKHTWTYRDGKKITGDFRGVTLYEE